MICGAPGARCACPRRARRDEQSAAGRPAALAAARTSDRADRTATSTPACAGSRRRGCSTRSCWRAPASSAWGASEETGASSTRAGSCRRRVRARSRSRVARATSARASAAAPRSPTAEALTCLLAERALAQRSAPRATRRSARYATPGRRGAELRAWVGAAGRLRMGSRRAGRGRGATGGARRRGGRAERSAGAGGCCCARAEEMAVPSVPSQARSAAGRVYLVGAGPGDPGLLSARALELIAAADVILYDRLIPREALAGRARGRGAAATSARRVAGPRCRRRRPRRCSSSARARGQVVVRLKGGDPFVFGRGGEEALAPARGRASRSRSSPASARASPRAPTPAFPSPTGGSRARSRSSPGHGGPPARTRRGRDSIGRRSRASRARSSSTWASPRCPRSRARSSRRVAPASEPGGGRSNRARCPTQRTVTGTLATIAEEAAARGDQAARDHRGRRGRAARSELPGSSAAAPAVGRTVAVTRARAQSSELARRLRALGAGVVEAPVIRIRRCPAAPLDPSPYDLICLTSANGVEALLRAPRRRAAATRARWPARKWRRSAPGPRGRSRSTGSARTSCPSASSPRA